MFQPFAAHVGVSSAHEKSKDTNRDRSIQSPPTRKKSKSSREPVEAEAETSLPSAGAWTDRLAQTIDDTFSQDSFVRPMNFSQEMSEKMEALSVYTYGTGSQSQCQSNSYADASAIANLAAGEPSDNSNDSFSIPVASTRATASRGYPADLAEERKITIYPPQLNPFITDTTSKHFPSAKSKRSTTTLWLSAYKDKPRFVTDFEVESMVGEGAFSTVYCVRNRYDGVLYALKRLKTQFSARDDLKQISALREVCALAALSECPSIVRYYISWIEDGYLYIQMELCLRRSLDMFVKAPLPAFVNRAASSASNRDQGISEKAAWRVLRTVASALLFMHRLGVAHMDIRPANVLISSAPSPDHPFIAPTLSAVPPSLLVRPNEDSRSALSSYSSAEAALPSTPVSDEPDVSPIEAEANIASGRWTLKVGDLGMCRLLSDTRDLDEGEGDAHLCTLA